MVLYRTDPEPSQEACSLYKCEAGRQLLNSALEDGVLRCGCVYSLASMHIAALSWGCGTGRHNLHQACAALDFQSRSSQVWNLSTALALMMASSPSSDSIDGRSRISLVPSSEAPINEHQRDPHDSLDSENLAVGYCDLSLSATDFK